MWYIKQNGRSLTPGGPHYHRIWTWTFLEYSVTTCKQHTKQKRKENERKWNKTMCKSKDMTCGADEKWEQVRIFSVHYCFVCLSESFTNFFFITWTILSFLIWYAFTQFSRQTTIIQLKKHVERKRLLKFQKSCYNQVFYVVHFDSLKKIIYFPKLFK